jgi:hypothetical protein
MKKTKRKSFKGKTSKSQYLMSPVLKKFHSDLDFDHSDLEARTVRRLKKKGKIQE